MTSKPVSVTIGKDGKIKPKRKYSSTSQKIRERKSTKAKPIRRIV